MQAPGQFLAQRLVDHAVARQFRFPGKFFADHGHPEMGLGPFRHIVPPALITHLQVFRCQAVQQCCFDALLSIHGGPTTGGFSSLHYALPVPGVHGHHLHVGPKPSPARARPRRARAPLIPQHVRQHIHIMQMSQTRGLIMSRIPLHSTSYPAPGIAAALLFTLVLTPVFALAQPAAPGQPGRPNVVIFLSDDLGWGDVGFHGGPIDTPALDRLAREGSEILRFYSTPICSPTRAALMTGRDPIRLGVVYATILPWLNHGIHTDEHFMSQSFQAAGYQTGIFGKWHLGHSQEIFHPNRRGFDHFYGHLHTEVGYFPPFSNLGGKDFQRNGQSIDEQGYETYLLAEEASRWIRTRNKDRPFFMYMPFIAPHTPLDAPDDLKAKYQDLKDDRQPARSPSDQKSRLARLSGRKGLRQIYAAVVEGMDRAIAQVLDTLDREGIADNTIVLFFNDNGGQAVYGAGGADNHPLRGGKGEAFDGGIRVPAVIRWPGRIPAGQRIDQLMTVMDVFPTLAAAAGIPTGNALELDGLNLWPALSGGPVIPRKEYVIFASETPVRGSISFAALNDEWKLLLQVEENLLSVDVQSMLFRIREDPHEYQNLAQEHPRLVQKLTRKINYWRTLYPISGVRSQLVPPPGWRAPKDWAGYPVPLSELQDDTSTGMAPPNALRLLDYLHGERGRLIYNCEPYSVLGGGFCR